MWIVAGSARLWTPAGLGAGPCGETFARSGFIGADDRPTPLLTQVEDDGVLPNEAERAGLAEVLRRLHDDVDGGGRWVHLATDTDLVPIPVDDVLMAAS